MRRNSEEIVWKKLKYLNQILRIKKKKKLDVAIAFSVAIFLKNAFKHANTYKEIWTIQQQISEDMKNM